MPVDANISISRTGLGNLVSARVSVDLYPYVLIDPSTGAVADLTPAIFHSDLQQKFTIIRVIFPSSFNLSDSIVNIEGGGQFGTGVTGLEGISNQAGFNKILPSSKGSMTIEPLVTDTTLAGTIGGSSTPQCTSMPCSHIFEMQTYAKSDSSVESSHTKGTIQRLSFTISSIVNPLYNPGPMPGALQQKSVQFGLQIFLGTVEGTRRSYFMKYYNNRINDPQLNQTTHYWFSRTGKTAVNLTMNVFSNVNLSFASPLYSQRTSAKLLFKTITGIPKDGSIAVWFPKTTDIQSLLPNISGSVTDVRSSNSFINVIGTPILIPASSRKGPGIVLYKIQAAIDRNEDLTLNLGGVTTTSAPSFGALEVESWNPANSTLDYGTSNSVPLQPNYVRNLGIGLSAYETGKTNVSVNVIFQINSGFEAHQGRISLRFPTSDLALAGKEPFLSTTAQFEDCSQLLQRADPACVVVEVCVKEKLVKGSEISLEISGFRTRLFAGPFLKNIIIETKEIINGSVRILDIGVGKPAQDLKPSSLLSLQATFPRKTEEIGNVTVRFTVSIPLSGFRSFIDIDLTPDFRFTLDSVVYLQGLRMSNFSQSSISIDLGGLSLIQDVQHSLIIVGVVSPHYTVARSLNFTTRSGDTNEAPAMQSGTYLDGSLLAQQMPNLQMHLNPLVSGAQSFLNVSFLCGKQLPAYAGIQLEFPDGFDFRSVDVIRRRNQTQVDDRVCSLETCNASFVWNETTHLLQGNFSLEYTKVYNYFDYALCGIAGSLRLKVIGNSLEMMLVDRVVSETWHPPLMGLKNCMKTEAQQCLRLCTASILANCSEVIRESYWVNITEPSQPLPVASKIEFKLEMIYNPRVSGLTGTFQLKTFLGAARFLEGSEVDGFLLEPAALTNPIIQLSDNNAYAFASFQIQFDLLNAFQPNDMIRIMFPPNCHFVPTQTVTPVNLVGSSVNDQLSVIDSNTSYVLLQRKGLSSDRFQGGVSFGLSEIQNRNGSAGDSGAWIVETVAYHSNITMDKGSFGVQLTTAHFKEITMDLVAWNGEAPMAAQDVNASLTLQVNQPMVPPDSRILIDFGPDLIVTNDTNVISDCKEPNNYVAHSPGVSWNYTCSFSRLDIRRAGTNLLEIERHTSSATHDVIGRIADENSFLTFNIAPLGTRATAGKVKNVTVQHVVSTESGPEIYEQDSVQVVALSPCRNQVSIQQLETSLGSKTLITVTLQICNPLTLEDRIGLFISPFISCHDQDCNSFQDADKFSISSDFEVTGGGLEYVSYQVGAISDSSIQSLQCNHQIGWDSGSRLPGLLFKPKTHIAVNDSVTFTLTGLRNPVLSPQHPPRVYVQTLSSALGVYGSVCDSFSPVGGFQVPTELHIGSWVTVSPKLTYSRSNLSLAFVSAFPGNTNLKLQLLLPDVYEWQDPRLVEVFVSSIHVRTAELSNITKHSLIVDVGPVNSISAHTEIRLLISGVQNPSYEESAPLPVNVTIETDQGQATAAVFGLSVEAEALEQVTAGLTAVYTDERTTFSFAFSLVLDWNLQDSVRVSSPAMFGTRLHDISLETVNTSVLEVNDALRGLKGSKLLWITPAGSILSGDAGLSIVAQSGAGFQVKLALGTVTVLLLSPDEDQFHINCTNNTRAPPLMNDSNCIYELNDVSSIPAKSRVTFSVGGYKSARVGGSFDFTVELCHLTTTHAMQRQSSVCHANILPRVETATANFFNGDRQASVGENGLITIETALDPTIAGQYLTMNFPAGARGFLGVESITVKNSTSVSLVSASITTVVLLLLADSLDILRFTLQGLSLRLPLLSGWSDPIQITSSRKMDGRLITTSYASGLIASVKSLNSSIVPLDSAARFGATVSTVHRLRYADIVIRNHQLIPKDGQFALNFPSAYDAITLVCDEWPLWGCTSAAQCLEGCDEKLTVVKSPTAVVLNTTANVYFNLTLQRRGGGVDIEAGSVVRLRLYNFSNKGFPLGHSPNATAEEVLREDFELATLTSEGYAIETGAMGDFTVTASEFEWLDASWSDQVDPAPSLCPLKQPASPLSDEHPGARTHFPYLSMKTTNAVVAGSTLRFSFPSADLELVTTAVNASMAVLGCSNLSSGQPLLSTLSALNLLDRGSCDKIIQDVSFHVNVSQDRVVLTTVLPTIVSQDTLITIFDIGKATDGLDSFRNKKVSGEHGMYTLETVDPLGLVTHQQTFYPAYCLAGRTMRVSTKNFDLTSNFSVSLTTDVAGEVGDMYVQFTYSSLIDLSLFESDNYLVIYFPLHFEVDAAEAEAWSSTIRDIGLSIAPQSCFKASATASSPSVGAGRFFFKLSALRRGNQISIKSYKNPSYAQGYSDIVDQPAMKGTFFFEVYIRSGSCYHPFASGQWQSTVVPGTLSSAELFPAVLPAGAFVVSLQIKFKTANIVPENATFVVRLPSKLLLTDKSRIVPSADVGTFTGSLESQVDYQTEYFMPYQCSSSPLRYCPGPVQNFSFTIESCLNCQLSGNNHYLSNSLVATRGVRLSNQTYTIPDVCVAPPMTDMRPGSFFVPVGCRLNGILYSNQSTVIVYKESPTPIPAGQNLSVTVVDVISPDEYDVLPGNIDLQIRSVTQNAIIDRNHRIMLQATGKGSLANLAADLSNQFVGQTTNLLVSFTIPGKVTFPFNITLEIDQSMRVVSPRFDMNVNDMNLSHAYNISGAPLVRNAAGSTCLTFLVEPTDLLTYVDLHVALTVSGLKNPTAGGSYNLIRNLAIRKLLTDSIQTMYDAPLYPTLSINPEGCSLQTQFSISPSTTADVVNLTVTLVQSYNSTGGLNFSVSVPSALQPSETVELSSVVVNQERHAAQVSVSLYPSPGGSVIVGQVIGLSLLSCPCSVSLVIGPFQTPQVQPPVKLDNFKLRILSSGGLASHQLSNWEQSLSWSSELSRVVCQSSNSSVIITGAGPITNLLTFSLQSPILGYWGDVNISFVTPVEVQQSQQIVLKFPSNSVSFCRQSRVNYPTILRSGLSFSYTTKSLTDIDTTSAVLNVTFPFQCAEPANPVILITPISPEVLPAGVKLSLNISEVRMPVTPISMQLEILIFNGTVSVANDGTLSWDSAVVQRASGLSLWPHGFSSVDLPRSNVWIYPESTSVSASTSFNILYHSRTGVPSAGYIEVDFPEGFNTSGAKLAGAAICGNASGFGGSIYSFRLPWTASSVDSDFVDRTVFFMNPYGCPVQENFSSDMTTILPTAFFGSTGGVPNTPYQGCVYKGLKISKITTFSISGDTRFVGVADAVFPSSVRYAIDNVCASCSRGTSTTIERVGNRTLRVRGFANSFPPFSLVNISFQGVRNAPLAGVAKQSYVLRSYDKDGRLLERASDVTATNLVKVSTNASVRLQDYTAHARAGFYLYLAAANPIQAGQVVVIYFPSGFDGAQTITQAVVPPAAEIRENQPSWLLSPGNVQPEVQLEVVSSDCEAQCNMLHLRVLSDVARGNTLCAKMIGSLRNPVRPTLVKNLTVVVQDPSGQDQMYNQTVPGFAITAGRYVNMQLTTNNAVVGKLSELQFQWYAESGISPTDYFELQVPPAFEFLSTGTDTQEAVQIRSLTNLRGALAVYAVNSSSITIRRNTSITSQDITVGFALGPFRNR
eukprot:750335-Hanusia_phi.AAC.2